MIKNFKKYVNFIGIFLFIYLIYKIDLSKIYALIKMDFNSNYFILLVLCSLFVTVLKAIRFAGMIDLREKKIFVAKRYFLSLFWANITPLKIGEFSKIFYFKTIDKYKIIAATLADRILDLIIVAILGVSFFSFEYNNTISIAVLIFIILLLFTIILVAKKYFINWFKIIFAIFKNKYQIGIISVLIIIGTYMKFFFGFWSAGIKMNFSLIIIISTIIIIVSNIPISYQGIGTRDLVLIYLFPKFDYSHAYGFFVANIILLNRFIMLLIYFLIWIYITKISKNEV